MPSSLPPLLDLSVELSSIVSRRAVLEDVETLIAGLTSAECEAHSTVDCARDRAEDLGRTLGGDTSADRFSAIILAADAVVGLALERKWQPREIDTLIAGLAEIVDRSDAEVRLALYLQTICDPRLLALPPALSIETTLRLLLAFAPVAAASFWVHDRQQGLRAVVRVGSGTRRMQAAADAALRGSESDSERSSVQAVPVKRWQHVSGVLAARPHAGQGPLTGSFVREAARMLGLALEREILLERGAARERSLAAASERRLARFGYDVHDGPLQDIGAARRELCLFRDCLEQALTSGAQDDDVLQRLDQLEEIVLASEIKLRELAQSAESPAILARSFRTLLEAEITSFVSASEIRADVQLAGDLDSLTGSQRIALVRIVQEALNNVREHSGASEIRLSVVRTPDRVEAKIVDDGRGFEVERTLVRSARRGRLGLIGMSERALLLGGALDVRSRPGGPTCVSVTLPEWRPLGSTAAAGHAPADLDITELCP